MSNITKTDACPWCGTPLGEVPLAPCRYHWAWEEDARNAERARLLARPVHQKVEEAESFEELRDILADYLRSLDT